MTAEPERGEEPSTPAYVDCRLGDLLDAVAQRKPAPGGGSVAAVTVSLAAALVAMAARFSLELLPDGPQLVEDADRLRRRSAELADLDSAAYEKVIASYAPSDMQDLAVRRDAIRTALRGASMVPLEIAGLGAETATLAARLMVDGNPKLRGDAATGLLLAEASVRAAAHLVRANVAAAGGDPELVRRAARSVAVALDASQRLGREPESA